MHIIAIELKRKVTYIGKEFIKKKIRLQQPNFKQYFRGRTKRIVCLGIKTFKILIYFRDRELPSTNSLPKCSWLTGAQFLEPSLYKLDHIIHKSLCKLIKEELPEQCDNEHPITDGIVEEK